MSRGSGRIMRVVLDLLTDEPMTVGTLAMKVFQTGQPPTRAEAESVRRACKRLAELGVADLEQRRNAHRYRRLYVTRRKR